MGALIIRPETEGFLPVEGFSGRVLVHATQKVPLKPQPYLKGQGT